MSPEAQKNPDVEIQKQEEKSKQQLEKQNIKPENTDIVKRLGFNLEKGEKIDQKTLETKMGEQFGKMSDSVGRGNQEAQDELNGIKQEFLKKMGEESDINEQLQLCELFLKEYNIAASTEIGKYIQRAADQSKKMNEEFSRNMKKVNEKVVENTNEALKEAERIQKQIEKLLRQEGVLVLVEKIRILQLEEQEQIQEKNGKRQQTSQLVTSAEQTEANNTMAHFQKPTTIV